MFIIMVFPAKQLLAQDDRYRVEILVLTHLGHDEEPREVPALDNFMDSLDFLAPVEEDTASEEVDEQSAGSETAETTEAGEGSGDLEPPLVDGEETADEEEDLSNAVIHIEEMSANMQDAWRRLRLSGPFRPEQYLSWEQGSHEPFPLLRIHDLESVLIEDPAAAIRAALKEVEQELMQLDAQGAGGLPRRTTGSGSIGIDDLLPVPTTYYRLDGTVKLRRTRFLHLDLDIQLREVFHESAATEPGVPAVTGQPPSAEAEPVEQPAERYRIHRLQQSRQVKSGRMEYFDSPVIGVLAYLTRIEPEDTPGDD
jgi:hypothetical protein